MHWSWSASSSASWKAEAEAKQTVEPRSVTQILMECVDSRKKLEGKRESIEKYMGRCKQNIAYWLDECDAKATELVDIDTTLERLTEHIRLHSGDKDDGADAAVEVPEKFPQAMEETDLPELARLLTHLRQGKASGDASHPRAVQLLDTALGALVELSEASKASFALAEKTAAAKKEAEEREAADRVAAAQLQADQAAVVAQAAATAAKDAAAAAVAAANAAGTPAVDPTGAGVRAPPAAASIVPTPDSKPEEADEEDADSEPGQEEGEGEDGEEKGDYEPEKDEEQLPDSKEAEGPGKRTANDAAGGTRQGTVREADDEEVKRARRMAKGDHNAPAIHLLDAGRKAVAKAATARKERVPKEPKERKAEESAPLVPTRETQYVLATPAVGAGALRSQPY